jgi:hypothetical protein
MSLVRAAACACRHGSASLLHITCEAHKLLTCLGKKNVTLALQEDLLDQARIVAAKGGPPSRS